MRRPAQRQELDLKLHATRVSPIISWFLLQLAASAVLIATIVGLITIDDNQAQNIHVHGLQASALILDAEPCYSGRGNSQFIGNRLTVQFTDQHGTVQTAQSRHCVSPEDSNVTTIWHLPNDPQTIVTREDLPIIARALHDTQEVGYIAFAVVGALLGWRMTRVFRARQMQMLPHHL